MQKTFILLILFYAINTFSQGDSSINSTYPDGYFISPLNIPLVLSGTFGELRSNHFHAGLDIKTQQKEGLNVVASAKGFISRIKISHWGYGKAIYITHPNGYTTVYAHLSKFSERIEAYIKEKQYKKESYEIQVFPSIIELPVEQNELIAYSGSTGGFVGPHLHFEIRNTSTEKPINPMFFGFIVNDSKKPRINQLIGYSFNAKSHINRIGKPIQLVLKKSSNGDLRASKINAFGSIGFGVNAYDQLDGASNKNGLYSLEMLVNGKKVHDFKADSFSFFESKYINLLIDYERYENLDQRIQKCFIEPSNKLDLYNNCLNNGYINIEDGFTYTIEIIAKDFKGNEQKVFIPVLGKKDSILVNKEIKKTAYKVNTAIFNKFTKNGVSVAFPKNTFYNDIYLDFDVKDSLVKVHTPTLPLNKNYTLTFDVSKYSFEQKKQLYIASVNEDGKTQYESTVKKETHFYTSIKKLGNYILDVDNEEPTIVLNNFKNEQWLTHFNTLKVKISDAKSGIKSYRGEIDGKWILMEYNVKNGMLTYNFNDKIFTTAKHNLKVTATDNVGNTKTINATFFRKK